MVLKRGRPLAWGRPFAFSEPQDHAQERSSPERPQNTPSSGAIVLLIKTAFQNLSISSCVSPKQ
jgi:hypothetical protein